MPFAIAKSPDGWNVLLDGVQAAEVVYDPHFRAWTIEADRERFPAPINLPSCFRGLHSHEVKQLPDVYRFFGVALPGVAEADTGLIRAARALSARLLEIGEAA